MRLPLLATLSLGLLTTASCLHLPRDNGPSPAATAPASLSTPATLNDTVSAATAVKWVHPTTGWTYTITPQDGYLTRTMRIRQLKQALIFIQRYDRDAVVPQAAWFRFGVSIQRIAAPEQVETSLRYGDLMDTFNGLVDWSTATAGYAEEIRYQVAKPGEEVFAEGNLRKQPGLSEEEGGDVQVVS